MRCAVVGSPIAHSLSPVMHLAAYEHLNLDWSYEAIEVNQGELAAFVDSLDFSWRGLSVTAPLKNEAAEIADHREAIVEQTYAANALIFDDGIHAYNTDVEGALNALAERQITTARHVTIMGAGDTARSMVEVAHRLNATTIVVMARRIDQAANLGEQARSIDETMEPTDLLISTIPASLDRDVSAASAIFDVTYSPWPSPLAEHSPTFISGIDLLAHQAALQVQLMTHSAVPVELLKNAALTQLGE